MSDALSNLAGTRAKIVLGIDGMVSPRHEHVIEQSLARMPGVNARASFASRTLRVEFDRDRCALPEIVRRLDELGLRLRNTTGELRQFATKPPMVSRVLALAGEYHKLTMAAVGALLLLGAAITLWTGGPPVLRYVLVALSFIIAGWYTAIDTFQILRQFRFDIDVLMFAAAFGAAALGKFEEGALLLVLFAFGGAGEELAMDRARRAIESLAKLAPEVATLRFPDGTERLVRVEDLKPNDLVIVRPSDRMPADGVVHSGDSAVDQSPITGESVPVEKTPGDGVFAGTINGQGLLTITVTRPAGESTIARIITMVRKAQTQKSPTQQFTERVERRYVPVVLIATAFLIFVPPLMQWGTWATWFYRAMAFLTAASPCALAIGTPAAVLSGIARAAQLGVLMKGGAHLENLARVRAIAFDKTGTLTIGRPKVIAIHPLDSTGEDEILILAAAVDSASSHPAAAAIVGEASARRLQYTASDSVTQLPGSGAQGIVDGAEIYVGKMSSQTRADPRLKSSIEAGQMLAEVMRDGKAIGVIALADVPRLQAKGAIAALHAMNIKPCLMLTGDRADVAAPIARELGLDDVRSDLMPEDKLKLIGELERQHGPIAMVGDGVNDAPALVAATVGIAMGGAGTDVAIETADVALMGDDLGKLPVAIALARFSRRVINQNLVIALGVISILAPLAALGYAYLGVAVLFHEGSTVVVVLNSMRLLFFKRRN